VLFQELFLELGGNVRLCARIEADDIGEMFGRIVRRNRRACPDHREGAKRATEQMPICLISYLLSGKS
jgi:hypothetical protein